MQPKLIGIAGGSGAGKTTLARMLNEREPKRYSVVRLDDYFKPRDEIPFTDGIQNYERPDALDFDRLAHDLSELKERATTPFVIVEGFLLLADERIRDLLDFSIYLDTPIETSLARRRLDPSKYSDDAYFRDILIPAHEAFVLPTKAYADWVLDNERLSAEETYQLVRERIGKEFSNEAIDP